MRKRLLSVLLMLIASATSAQNAHAVGCYVDFENPNYCSADQIFCDVNNYDSNYDQFGFSVGDLCARGNNLYHSLNSCSADVDTLSQQNAAMATEANKRIKFLNREVKKLCKFINKKTNGRCKLKRAPRQFRHLRQRITDTSSSNDWTQ